MKLSVAATLLAQCVPALPQALPVQDLGSTTDRVIQPLNQVQEATRSTDLFQELKRVSRRAKQRVLAKVQGVLKNGSPLSLKGRRQCDPSSTDADTGILSCADGLICTASQDSDLGGFCQAISASQGTAGGRSRVRASDRKIVTTTYRSVPSDKGDRIPCDPNAPDLGILSCGPGEFCRQVGYSDMGGICFPTAAAARRLYTVDEVIAACDMSSTSYDANCDCTDVNLNAGNGTMTCLTSGNVLCEGVIADVSYIYSFTSRYLASAAFCYAITEPYYQKACIVSNFPSGANVPDSCTIEFNGQECSSCVASDSFFDFDCSAIDPNVVGSNVTDLLPAISACYLPGVVGNYSVCALCTEGTTIPAANYGANVSIAGMGYVSCGDLAYGAAIGLVPDAYCAFVAGITQSSCCAPASTEPVSTPEPSSAAGGEPPAPAPEDGEPAPAPEGGEPAPAPEGGEPAPAPDGGSSAALVLVHGVVWSVIVSTLAQIFVS